MRIADLPVQERPRERLAALGAEALSARELLAVLLGTGGTQGVGAHVLAERLLGRFGSLGDLARAHPADLAAVPGIGTAKAAVLHASFALSRCAEDGNEPNVIRSSEDLARVAAPLLRERSRERLVVVTCDQSHRVLGLDVASEGAADRSLVPVREVIVTALRRDGRAFALAHNHPCGDLEPSTTDIAATRQVAEAAQAVGLRFLDHVVLTDTSWHRITTAH